MLPPWFRAVVLVEVVGAVVVAILGIRLATTGVHAAGEVVAWGRSHAAQVTADPPALGGRSPRPAPPSRAPAATSGIPAGPLLDRLDADTAATARGELGLLGELETAIRTRVERLLGEVSRR